MLALFWVGAVASAYLGYRLHEWWIPTAVALVAAAGQFAFFQMAGGGRGPIVQLIAYGVMDLVMFHATFGIGRSLGQRRLRRRKGMR